jgi:hypothetical protein
MIIVVTFTVGDLSAGLTPSNQWKWHGPCKAEMPTDDPASTNWNADLSVVPISECGDHLRSLHVLSKFNKQPVAQQLEEELSAAQTNGTADAMIVRKYKEAILGVTIGLRPQRYELFRTFVTLHFGRPDLMCRIITSFVGFAASSEGGLTIPNYNEFLEGRPYLILDDCSIAFSAKPLP